MSRAETGIRLLLAGILLLPAAWGCQKTTAPPPGGRRLILVAVDGATWSVISPLMEQGRLPYLAGLYRAGSAGRLKSLEPMLPAALWTTVATGKSRGAHAIEAASEKIPGKYAVRPITADRRRAPALWTIAGSRGLTVGVTSWAVTFPAEPVNGFLIAEGYDPPVTGDHGYLYPEGALGKETAGGESLKLSDAALRVARLDESLRRSFEEDLASLSKSAALYRVYQPRIALFRFLSIDFASHRFWQYHETRYLDLAASRGVIEDPARVAAMAEALPGAYDFFDEWLGQLLERLPEKSTILIVSDHGFRGVLPTDGLHVDLNELLGRLGFLTFSGEGGIDWARTRAFTLDDIGGLRRSVFLNVKGREERGAVEERDIPAVRERVTASLRELKSDLGDPVFRTVSVNDRPGPGEPDILLVENLGIDPHGIVRVKEDRLQVTALFRRDGEDFGTHDPSGIFLAAGDGIAAGRTGWSAGLYDIVPTALCLMGLPLASDLPGRPVVDILATAPPPGYPMVPTYNVLPPAPTPVRRPEGLAAAELNRLRAIGHLR